MKLSRRLTQLALRLMPRPVRFNIIRNGMKLNDDELRRVEAVRIASTIDEYVAAMTLVHDGYVNRGIMAPHESRIRMTHYLALPSTIVFVALESGQVAGTLSLVKDGPVGLPMQKIYGDEIQALRDQGRAAAEVGALCITPGRRGNGMSFLLYKTMFLTAWKLLGVDDLVMAVHPDAADLYAATLTFERIGPVREYPALDRSALAVAMRLDLRTFEQKTKDAWGALPKTPANPHWLYFERNDPQITLPTSQAIFDDLLDLHRKASMKLASLRPDIVLDLDPKEFQKFRGEMSSKDHPRFK